jgi:predicted RNA-binding Zn-ribbon protein involved in translation (DUF1610 family)
MAEEKQLRSLAEHNQEALEQFRDRVNNSQKSGFACPNCGEEMIYPDTTMLASYPPKRNIQCTHCNYRDYAY